MEEKRLQSIGIDLSSDFASVACLEAGSSLPVSMSVREIGRASCRERV